MENNRAFTVRHWVDDRLATLTAPADWEPDTGAGMVRFRRGREARSRATRMYLWIGAAAASVVAVLLAFPGPRVFAQRCVDACLAETAVAPGFLHRRAAAAQTGRQPAPDFTLLDASGNTVRLSGLRGQVVLLNFWATWCAPCQVEIPWFVALHQQHGGAGLAVVGVAMDDDGWESVRPDITGRGIDYPVVVGNDIVAQDFGGVDALPTTLLIDRSGRIAALHRGLVDLATIDAEVRDLLKGRGCERMQLVGRALLSAAFTAIAGFAAQSPNATDWQTAAGGKMAFDVASVKPSTVFRPPTFPLNAENAKPSGGRFSASFPLLAYIGFAYKLSMEEQSQIASAWVRQDSFTVDAEARGDPTKDQMRLMVQVLLAGRF